MNPMSETGKSGIDNSFNAMAAAMAVSRCPTGTSFRLPELSFFFSLEGPPSAKTVQSALEWPARLQYVHYM